MIDEPRLIRALDEVVRHLVRLNRPVVPLLQRGLTNAEISQLEAMLPFPLTEELRALYRWRNGTRTKEGDLLQDLWFFPGFYLPSFEEAARTFNERRLASQWRDTWFPFFMDGAGDFYVVPCPRQQADATAVIGFIHGEPEQDVEYLDITTMIETLAAAYSQGAFFVADDDSLEMDDEAHRRVAQRYNPGISEWES